MKISEAKKLVYHDTLHDKMFKNADGTPQRWRVSGKVKTWKRNPNKIKVPIKRGLYENSYIDENNVEQFVKVNKFS